MHVLSIYYDIWKQFCYVYIYIMLTYSYILKRILMFCILALHHFANVS